MSICNECAANSHLKRRIQKEGVEGKCTLCKRKRSKVFSVVKLGEVLGPVIEENFFPNTGVYDGGGDEPLPSELKYVSLQAVIEGILGQEIDFSDELIEIFIGKNDHREFFNSDALYAQVFWYRTAEPRQYLKNEWRTAVDELKHNRRFFSESVRDFFAKIFADVENVTSHNLATLQSESVMREEPAGFRLYRGRIIEENDFEVVTQDPYKHVGPPPVTKAGTGRMNPEGVIALYCAQDKETAIAELRPSIGQICAVIELRFSRALRLLDFTRLEKALDHDWTELLDPQFDEKADVRGFLRKLHRRISQPVVPGKETTYLITQTMAEYLAHVHQPGFDGIVFGSAQCEKGKNLVLFGEPKIYDDRREFGVEYVKDTLTFHQVNQVEYKHSDARGYVEETIFRAGLIKS